MDTNTFFQQIEQNGLTEGLCEQAPSLDFAGAEDELFSSLAVYWQKNPTLAEFSTIIHQLVQLPLDKSVQQSLIKRLNLLYLEHTQELPTTLEASYDELSFWDGCPMPECKKYVDAVTQQFFVLLKANPLVTPEIVSILQQKNPSPEFIILRDNSLTILRNALQGRLASQIAPLARLETFLLYATGECGYTIVDKTFWATMSQSCISSASADASIYTSLRQALIAAANNEILDRPKSTIERIDTMLQKLDTAVDYGIKLDPQVVLYYWRSIGFVGISDEALLTLYKGFLRAYPQRSGKLMGDITTLANEERNDASRSLSALLASTGEDVHDFNSSGSSKGQGSSRAKKGFFAEHRFIIISLLIICFLLVIVFVMNKLGFETPASFRIDEEIVSPSPEESIEESDEVTDEISAEATETPAETPEATQADETPNATTATPEPTVEPTPESTVAPSAAVAGETVVTDNPEVESTPEETPQPTEAPTEDTSNRENVIMPDENNQ